MAPTEQTLLTNFLLPPASLPSILTFREFVALFPERYRTNPLLATLYRDLQHQRAIVTDAVAEDIEDEVRRGERQRRAAVRARKAAQKEEQDDEVDIERSLFGATSSLPTRNPHTLRTILPELQSATEMIEFEIQELEEEAARLHDEVQASVEALSDLRYGTFANPALRDEILDGLQRLEGICEQK